MSNIGSAYGACLVVICFIIVVILVALLYLWDPRGRSATTRYMAMVLVLLFVIFTLIVITLVYAQSQVATQTQSPQRRLSRLLSTRFANLERVLQDDIVHQILLVNTVPNETYVNIDTCEIPSVAECDEECTSLMAILCQIKTNNEKAGDYYASFFGPKVGSELTDLLNQRSQLLYEAYVVILECNREVLDDDESKDEKKCKKEDKKQKYEYNSEHRLDDLKMQLKSNSAELARLLADSKRPVSSRPAIRRREPETETTHKFLDPQVLVVQLNGYYNHFLEMAALRCRGKHNASLDHMKQAKLCNQSLIQHVIGHCWNLFASK